MEIKKKLEIWAMWDWLVDNEIATEDELILVTDINGFKMGTLIDVLYARTGYSDRKEVEEKWLKKGE